MTSAISGSPSWRRRAARWAIQWSATLLSPKAGSPMSCPRPIPNRHAIRRDQEFFLVSFLWRGSLQGPASMVVGGEVPPPRFKIQKGETKRMKKLSVVVAGTGQIRDVEIQPGTTAGDILHQLNLPDYLLSKGPNEPFFAAAESVYDK